MIKVYGADWCGDTRKTLNYLDTNGIEHEYINVEENAEASEWVKNQNKGKELKPTVLIGEKILSVPSESELNSALKEQNLIS
jgi:glutaredoxin